MGGTLSYVKDEPMPTRIILSMFRAPDGKTRNDEFMDGWDIPGSDASKGIAVRRFKIPVNFDS